MCASAIIGCSELDDIREGRIGCIFGKQRRVAYMELREEKARLLRSEFKALEMDYQNLSGSCSTYVRQHSVGVARHMGHAYLPLSLPKSKIIDFLFFPYGDVKKVQYVMATNKLTGEAVTTKKLFALAKSHCEAYTP